MSIPWPSDPWFRKKRKFGGKKWVLKVSRRIEAVLFMVLLTNGVTLKFSWVKAGRQTLQEVTESR